jgi:hypothetical protein
MQARNRRVFMLRVITGTTVLAAQGIAHAQAPAEPVKETDAYPKSMGFRLDTSQVDKAPRHEASQKCSECQLFSAKAGEALGTCSFFKRQVPPDGWCRNFKPRKPAA